MLKLIEIEAFYGNIQALKKKVAGDAMYEELKDPRFAPPVLLRKKVAAGQFGRKSRKGFYDYGTSPHSSGEAA